MPDSFQEPHRATAPIPEYDFDDPDKSFVVELIFGSDSAISLDAFVGESRSRSHVGDPPLLELRLTDEDGGAAGRLDAWDPRWNFEETASGGERMVIRAGPGVLTMPFDSDVASLTVRDQQADVELTTVDLRPTVHDYCVDNPDDPQCVEADLAVVSTSVVSDPLGVVGEASGVQVDTVVSNLGPDGPVDGDVSQVATGSAGLSVSPSGRTLGVDGLTAGGSSSVSGSYSVTCLDPGPQSVIFESTVAPNKAKVADLNASNDGRSILVEIECILPVTINVRPGHFPNRVNAGRGAVEVGVLTTNAGEYGLPLAFDAAWIDADSLRFASREDALVGDGSPTPRSPRSWDVKETFDERTRDGDRDLRAHFTASQTGLVPGQVEACIVGSFQRPDGTGGRFIGCDSVVVLP